MGTIWSSLCLTSDGAAGDQPIDWRDDRE